MIFVYNTIFILLFGKIIKSKLCKQKYKKMFLFVTFFQMFLIQGLRANDVGTDTSFYVSVFDNYLHSEYYSFLFTHYEPGFQFLYRIMHIFHLDSQWLLLSVSAITMVCFAYFIYKNSDDMVLSTFIFSCIIFPNSLNIMRQCLGLGIAINSLYFILNKKYVKSFIIIAFASLFHSTSILMLIPLILHIVKNWKLTRNIILFLGIVFFLFGNQLMSVLLPYFGKSFYLNGFGVQRMFRMTTMLAIVIAFISWYFLRNSICDQDYKRKLNLFSCIAFVNAILGLLYLKFEFFSRIIEYFNAFLIVSIPTWIIVGRKRYRQIYQLGFCLVAFFLMLNGVYNSGSGIENYHTFFM